MWAHPDDVDAADIEPIFDAALDTAWRWASATQTGAQRLSVRWQVIRDAGDPRTSGGSVGAAAAVGLAYLIGLLGSRRVDPRSALSATVDEEGILGSVSELPAKLGRGGSDWRRLVVCREDEQTAKRAVRGDLPKVLPAEKVLQAARLVARPRISIRTGLAAATVTILAMGLVSWYLVGAATAAARVSRVNARDSRAFHLASVAGRVAPAEPATALRLAISAFRLDPGSVDTQAALMQLTQADPRIRSFLGAEGNPAITHLAGSSAGRVVISADIDGTVRSWHPPCSACSPSILSQGTTVRSIAVSQDGLLVAVARGNAITLTTPTGSPPAGWPTEAIRVDATADTVAINSDGSKVAVGTSNGGVYVWTRGRPSPEHSRMPSSETVSAAVFLPDGRLVTGTAAPDTTSPQELVVWKDLPGGLAKTVLVPPKAPSLIFPGVRALAVVGRDLVIGETYLEVRPLNALNTVKTFEVTDAVDALVPLDSTHVLVGTTSSLALSPVPLLQGTTPPPTTFIEVGTITGQTEDAPFSASLTSLTPASVIGPNHTILSGLSSGAIAEWSLAPPEASEVLRIVPDPMTPSGVIVSRDNGSVDAFDAATGHESTIASPSSHGPATALTAKGKDVYVGYSDGTVLRLARQSSAPPVKLLHLPEKVFSLALDPAGQTLATGGSSGQVALFDAATGKLLRTLPHPHAAAVYAIAFDPSGQLVASSDIHDHVLVQRTGGTATESTALLSVGLLAWLSDSELIAGDGRGNLYRLRLPLPANPEPIAQPDTSNILGGGLDPSHRTLVIASADQEAVLFDVTANQTLGRFPTLDATGPGAFAGAAWAASFTSDGRYAVFGTTEGHLQTLTVDTAILAATACAMAPTPPETSVGISRVDLEAARSACR